MQSIDFQNGHHLDITTMNFIQEAYTKPILAMAAAAKADSYIVSGVELTENGVIATWSNGYIVLNGEPMEFRGGTYNGNDEDAESYVVRREETLYNINANGNSVPALTRVYATLGAEESGAMSIIKLSDYRIRSFVSVRDTGGVITLTENVRLVENNVEALECGYQGADEALPRYLIKGNQLFIKGVFILTSSYDHASVAIGTIPQWEGGKMSVKAIKQFYWGTDNVTYRQGIWANIQDNGTITVPNIFGDMAAIIFDCTPSTIM